MKYRKKYKYTHLHIIIPPEMGARLKEISKILKISISSFVRAKLSEAIEKFFEQKSEKSIDN